jgi:hypothetical protein
MKGNARDINKRLRAMGLPITLCVKYERLCGVKPGKKPTFVEKIRISEAMISAMEVGVRNVVLTSTDYQLIAAEVHRNEKIREAKSIHAVVDLEDTKEARK